MIFENVFFTAVFKCTGGSLSLFMFPNTTISNLTTLYSTLFHFGVPTPQVIN